jgi:glycosyltransferase involved in cell wall biosynthesis
MKTANALPPKVLIIGLPFNNNTGGGITMSNLFKGWPKDRLALSSVVNMQETLDLSVCEQYFQLGYGRKLHPFPLNFFLPRIKMGPVDKFKTENNPLSLSKVKQGKYKNFYKFLCFFLNLSGIYNIIYRLKITPEFKEWVTKFNPDFIYSQLSTLELIRFVMDVHNMTGKPIIVHLMDDWPITINKPGVLYFYWKKVIDREFRQLLDKASVLMSICDAMTEEYRIRYGKDFIPFHNPIEICNWLPFTRTDWTVNSRFTILFAGRIGFGVTDSILDIIEAVNDPILAEIDIVLELQTADISTIKKLVKFSDRIKWVEPIEYENLPRRFANVDLLVIPLDFDTHSVNFLRYSFSTKVTEFMISGTPILVYASEQTALAKYALKENWAYVVTHRSKKDLISALHILYSDFSLRKRLGELARNLATQNEDAEIVRANFRNCFNVL